MHLCTCACGLVCVCRWLPVKVRRLPHFRSTWQCWLKRKKRWRGVPPVWFPQWRPSVLPQLCMWAAHWSFRKKKKKEREEKTLRKRKSDLPRAQWMKPKYLCLRKSCYHGDDSPSGAQQQPTWLPVPSLSVCFWYFCTEGWKWLTYYLIIRMFRDLGEFFCFRFYMKVETSLDWKGSYTLISKIAYLCFFLITVQLEFYCQTKLYSSFQWLQKNQKSNVSKKKMF